MNGIEFSPHGDLNAKGFVKYKIRNVIERIELRKKAIRHTESIETPEPIQIEIKENFEKELPNLWETKHLLENILYKMEQERGS